MRGVAGGELEILRAKAAGLDLNIWGPDPRRLIVEELRARGLLRLAHIGTNELGGKMLFNEITRMGRVVLAVSS